MTKHLIRHANPLVLVPHPGQIAMQAAGDSRLSDNDPITRSVLGPHGASQLARDGNAQ